MTRPRPCLACTIDKARSAKANAVLSRSVVSAATASSPCGDARCQLRTDPVSLFMRWLRPPPPPRDPAAVLREYASLLASAGGGAAAAAGGALEGGAPVNSAAAETAQSSK